MEEEQGKKSVCVLIMCSIYVFVQMNEDFLHFIGYGTGFGCFRASVYKV